MGVGAFALFNVLSDASGKEAAVSGSGGNPEGNGEFSERFGNASDNQIVGSDDNELIQGFNGNDILSGSGGRDLIVGDNGDDALQGGAGLDLLIGGSGNDSLGGGSEDDDLVGGSGNDSIVGAGGSDFLIGMDGDNLLDGGADNDLLIGLTPASSAVDPLYPYEVDTLSTNIRSSFTVTDSQANRILKNFLDNAGGIESSDSLMGGTGDDTLIGDAGDTLAGGGGSDVFQSVLPAETDPSLPAEDQIPRVTDFDPSTDKIEVLVEGADPRLVTVSEQGGGLLVSVSDLPVMFIVGRDASALAAEDVALVQYA